MSALKEALKEPIKEPADLDYNINRFYSVVLASSAKFVAQLENLKSYSHIAKKMHNANLSQAIDNYVANEWFVINIARRLEKPHGKTCPVGFWLEDALACASVCMCVCVCVSHPVSIHTDETVVRMALVN